MGRLLKDTYGTVNEVEFHETGAKADLDLIESSILDPKQIKKSYQ